MYGECSILSSVGPAVPAPVKENFQAGINKDYETLVRLQHRFRDMGDTLFGPLRSPRRIDGAYDKMLVRLGGFEEMPLRLLSPYHGFSEEDYQACKQRFHQGFPDWATS
jgi:hypothetical protein